MVHNEKQREAEKLVGVAFNLSNLIAYQEGSVVSRTIIAKDAGTVTLFAFAQGQGLSEHTAPFDAMVQVLDGEGTFIIGGKEHVVSAGSIIIMPGGIPHAVKAHQKFKMLLTMIRS